MELWVGSGFCFRNDWARHSEEDCLGFRMQLKSFVRRQVLCRHCPVSLCNCCASPTCLKIWSFCIILGSLPHSEASLFLFILNFALVYSYFANILNLVAVFILVAIPAVTIWVRNSLFMERWEFCDTKTGKYRVTTLVWVKMIRWLGDRQRINFHLME